MPDRPRIVVTGLGPGGRGQHTEEAATAIASADRRFVRTLRHPSADLLPDDVESFDRIYDRSDQLADVYAEIADEMVAAASADPSATVCYVVPGSPLVLERSVARLRSDDRVDVELVPAMSFLDVAWARLGIDPVESRVRLVDGHVFADAAAGEQGPLLVAHAHAPWVLSDIKLAIDAGEEQKAVVLQRLGTPDEAIFEVPWPELDRSFEPDHLTSLYLPEVAAPVAGELLASVELMHRLRQDCPWDAEQTHESLRPYLLEEAYEVLEALDELAVADEDDGAAIELLEEELGDLWFQVLFHAELAAEAGWFTVGDVARRLHDKLVSRHPHVFGEVAADDAATVVKNWELSKKKEKGRASILDGIPAALPALAFGQKVVRRAERGEMDAADDAALWAALGADAVPLDEAEVGRRLLALTELARRADVDAEQAMRLAVSAARHRYQADEAEGRRATAAWLLG